MMKIYLIRHSMTTGNLKKRYIGRTDEPLCEEGIALLEKKCRDNLYPRADRVFVSPMKRCTQTAQIIYPDQAAVVIEKLAECDFGKFENKNYEELNGSPEYQEWIDSNGTLPFPEGESRESFKERSLSGFSEAMAMCDGKEAAVAFIVHGGTIMSIMEQYAFPKGEYYDYQPGNGEGYELDLEDDVAGAHRICSGSHIGRSQVALSSGKTDRSSDHRDRKNYKKLSS